MYFQQKNWRFIHISIYWVWRNKIVIKNVNIMKQVSHDHRSFERNLSNCEQKPEKVRTLTGFEPVTLRYWCDALTNWAMKPLTLGAGHLWVLMSPCRMDVKWYMKCFIYWTADLKYSNIMKQLVHCFCASVELWTVMIIIVIFLPCTARLIILYYYLHLHPPPPIIVEMQLQLLF